MQAASKATILVVEDDVHLLEGVRDILMLDGYDVLTAQNGTQALSILREHPAPPDLIVSDIMMPEMNGIDFLKAVREDSHLLSIPFIFLTARGEKADYYQGMRLGVDDYVVKPYEPADLLVKIESRLQRHRALNKVSQDNQSNLKRQILTILNHEFRTPLTFVVAYSDMLNNPGERGLSETEMLSYLKGVGAGAERLRQLVENFILMVELETGDARETFKWRKTTIKDLYALVNAARDRVRELASGVNPLTIEVDSAIPPIEGDKEYLVIALSHLLKNAFKFSEPGKPIRVHAGLCGDEVCISVADQGRGIPKEELGRIWESFYQINRAVYEDQGAGAGLPIVRGVVSLHGGRITVESDVGVGSTFSIYLPLATSAAATA